MKKKFLYLILLLIFPSLVFAGLQINPVTGKLDKVGNSASGSGTPGGSSPQIQYNNSGAFGGISNSAVDSNGNVTIGTTQSGVSGVGKSVLTIGESNIGIGTSFAQMWVNPTTGFHRMTFGSINYLDTSPALKIIGKDQTENVELALVQGPLRNYGGYFNIDQTTSDLEWFRRTNLVDNSVFTITNATGCVGIGTTLPVAKLDIHGSQYNSGPNAQLAFEDRTTAGSAHSVQFYSTGDKTKFYSFSKSGGAGDLLAIDNTTGNLGLGTTSPTQVIESAVSGTNYNIMNMNNYSATSTRDSEIQLNKSHNNTAFTNTATVDTETLGAMVWLGNSGSGFTQGARIQAFQNGTAGTNTPADLAFYTSTGAAQSSQRMLINKFGNVGINSASPGQTLDVQGTVRISSGSTGVGACWCTTPAKVLGYCTGVIGTCSACNFNGGSC